VPGAAETLRSFDQLDEEIGDAVMLRLRDRDDLGVVDDDFAVELAKRDRARTILHACERAVTLLHGDLTTAQARAVQIGRSVEHLLAGLSSPEPERTAAARQRLLDQASELSDQLHAWNQSVAGKGVPMSPAVRSTPGNDIGTSSRARDKSHWLSLADRLRENQDVSTED
jgi:hypothetical protein